MKQIQKLLVCSKQKQLGVAVKAGAEGIVHATSISFEKLEKFEKKSGIVQTDFKNAFSSVKISKVLEALVKFLPSVALFANFATHNTVMCNTFLFTTHI